MATSKFIVPLILFFLTVASGFWVSKTGKPYNTGIFTLHKLLALAAVVFAAIITTKLLKTTTPQPIIITLIILAIVSVIALFATGAMMSIQKTVGSTWLLIHRVAPFVLAGTTTSLFLTLIKIA